MPTTTELVRFDLNIALRIVQDMGCGGVLTLLANKPSPPANMEEFLSCFTQESVQEEFLGRYVDKL